MKIVHFVSVGYFYDLPTYATLFKLFNVSNRSNLASHANCIESRILFPELKLRQILLSITALLSGDTLSSLAVLILLVSWAPVNPRLVLFDSRINVTYGRVVEVLLFRALTRKRRHYDDD